MSKKFLTNTLAAAGLAFVTGTASALPALQLDIAGGTYDPVTQTVIASSNTFTLYAYLTNAAQLSETYYLSLAALTNGAKIAQPGGNYGSFVFNGGTINVTGDMVYGSPPLEVVATQLADPGDLPPHDIFPTYFSQSAGFQFDAAHQTTPYNTQDNPGAVGVPDGGTGMYYVAFTFDVSGLTAGTGIHVDLYDTKIVTCANNPHCVPGDIDINDFAPFSHDAQSGPTDITDITDITDVTAPEPATTLLLGVALLGLALLRRRQVR